MDDQRTNREGGSGIKHKAVPIAIAIVLVLFALPLIGAILYGGGGAALGGLAIIAVLIAIQYPLMRLLIRKK